MRTKILKLIAVLSMVLLAFNGCKKDEGEEPNPTPEPPAPKIETKVSDDVVMIIPKEGKKIEDYIVSYTTDEIVLEFPDNSTNRSAENSTELIQTFNGNKLTDLKEGQIISIPPNDKVKTGTLKKVSSITKERIKNKIKIKMAVVQPNLVEVFKNGLDEDHTFNFFQLFSGGKAEVEVPKDKWGLKFSAELDASKNKFSIIGEGYLNFWVDGKKTDSKFKTLIGVELSNLKINLHLKHKPNAKGPQFAKLSLSGEIATYMDAELNIKFKKKFDSDPFLLGRIKLPPTPIGSTPLYIQPILELTMKRGLSGVLEVSARLFEFTHPFLYAVGYDENKSNKWFIETGKEKVKFTNIADNFTDNLNIDGKVELKDNFEILLHYAFMDWKGAEFYVGGGVENNLQFKYKGSEKKISLKDDIFLYLLGGMDFYILYETLGLRKEYRLDIKSWNLYEKDFDFNKEAKRLILSADTLNLRKGESSIVKITSGNGKYEVDSDNKNIVLASLNEKNEVVINSIAVGIATVTVVDNISKAKKEIKVTVTEADNNLVLSANSITLKEGEHKVVNITSGSGVYIVKSNNESVVLANEVKAGVIGIIAKGAGNATVIVKDKATKQQKTIEVTVTKALPNLVVTSKTAELMVGGQYRINITSGSGKYSVSSQNSHIATASLLGNAIDIVGKSKGNTTVLLEDKESKETVSIAVKVNPKEDDTRVPEGVIIKDGILIKWPYDKIPADGHVTVPDGVTAIGYAAFVNIGENEYIYKANYNDKLISVKIPNSVKSINKFAFYRCTKLKIINIPNSVTTIGNNAFSVCRALTSITIPNSVTSIGNEAFLGCGSLSSVTLPNSIVSIGDAVFYSCSSLSSITIPNSVTSIGDEAFLGCKSLSSIVIPNSVTKIGRKAFFSCRSLTSITIPNSVTSIEMGAFAICSSLTSIILPNSIVSIQNSVFLGCSSLSSITIPNSVTNIEGAAFGECSSLETITIPNSVTNIGYGAFGECSSLKTITIPNSVITIDKYAFDGCSLLTSITIPNSVTTIEEGTFRYCKSLLSITIPNAAKYINTEAFSGCDSLQELICKPTVPAQFFAPRGIVPKLDYKGKLIVPKGTKHLYEKAFLWKDCSPIVEE
jgi:surface antigen bspA-like